MFVSVDRDLRRDPQRLHRLIHQDQEQEEGRERVVFVLRTMNASQLASDKHQTEAHSFRSDPQTEEPVGLSVPPRCVQRP